MKVTVRSHAGNCVAFAERIPASLIAYTKVSAITLRRTYGDYAKLHPVPAEVA